MKIKAEKKNFFTEPCKSSTLHDEGKAPFIACIACNRTDTLYHHNNNNICQASTLSSEEITKIKQVFLFYSKT